MKVMHKYNQCYKVAAYYVLEYTIGVYYNML